MRHGQIQAYDFLVNPGEEINNDDLWAEVVQPKAEAVAEKLEKLPQFAIFRGES